MQEKPRSYLVSEIRASAAAKKWWRGQICDNGIFMRVFLWECLEQKIPCEWKAGGDGDWIFVEGDKSAVDFDAKLSGRGVTDMWGLHSSVRRGQAFFFGWKKRVGNP
jgi:hypothetical protein